MPQLGRQLPDQIDGPNQEPTELHCPPPPSRSQRRIFYSGSGMNSVSSPGTSVKRLWRQSSLACSIRSLEDETKFHQMWRALALGSPPSSIQRASALARHSTHTPSWHVSNRPPPHG